MSGRELQRDAQIGTSTWVRSQLRAMPADDSWNRAACCRELILWLYPIAVHRAAMLGVARSDQLEVAQDAMPRIVGALKNSRGRMCQAQNPAAVLERVTARAVWEGVHRLWMAGFGGVQPNGRTWRRPFPRTVHGDTARDLMDAMPYSPERVGCQAEGAAERVADWVAAHVGVRLIPNAVDAVVYVLDRLSDGITRAGLVRGGRVGLAGDPALRHLGFDRDAARSFAGWLLGRTDGGREMPAVLDAALLGDRVSVAVLAHWREVATQVGFAVAIRAPSEHVA